MLFSHGFLYLLFWIDEKKSVVYVNKYFRLCIWLLNKYIIAFESIEGFTVRKWFCFIRLIWNQVQRKHLFYIFFRLHLWDNRKIVRFWEQVKQRQSNVETWIVKLFVGVWFCLFNTFPVGKMTFHQHLPMETNNN